MSWTPDPTDRLCVNTIRMLAVDAVEKAASGHPGLPLGAAPMAYALWQRHLAIDARDPRWPDRDRFVLSAGHGSALLYALLHLYGYDLPLEQLQRFRQWESRTPGHPEWHLTAGVEATTGPLGQGAAVSVGMAIAERMLAARYNRPGQDIVNHRTFALVGDGDLMEGISAEAASLAGHLALGKLTWLYDDNRVSLDAPTDVTFTEDVAARFAAYGWHVRHVEHGDTDLVAIDAAIEEAIGVTDRPSLVLVHTTIGFGAPHVQNTPKAHGAPLGADEVRLTKQALGWDPDRTFFVPDEARARFGEATARGRARRDAWLEAWQRYQSEAGDLARELAARIAGELPSGWEAALPSFDPAAKAVATRDAGGTVLDAIAQRVPAIVGGDADLSGSTKTRIKGSPDFEPDEPLGRNIRYGVREHAMGGISNGLAYHGGFVPFSGTFLAFSDYMRTPIRLAALDHLPVAFVFTHDSLGVGEDGPTHQPVEQVTALRAVPGLFVVRPADANEVAAAWRWFLAERRGPMALVLTRQKVPTLAGTRERAADGLARGAYVLAEAEGGVPDAIVVATGSEVALAVAARDELAREGVRVRVVSMPCMGLFEKQDRTYRDRVLPPAITARVAVEAGVGLPWYRWTGDRGEVIAVDRFGASAPGEKVLEEYGFSAAHVAEAVRRLLRSRL